MEQNSIYKQFRCVVRSEVEPRDKNVLWWNMNDSALYSFYNGVWIKEHTLEIKDLINQFKDLKNIVITFEQNVQDASENAEKAINKVENINIEVNNINNKIEEINENVSTLIDKTLTEQLSKKMNIDGSNYVASLSLVSPSISSLWTIKKQDNTQVTTSTSNNLNVENGAKVDYLGTSSQPTPSASQIAPQAISGDFGTSASGSKEETNITANKTFRVIYTAPKSGLEVSGTKVVKASGDQQTSASASVAFLHKIYWGVSANSNLEDFSNLDFVLSNNRERTINFDCSGGKYFYYAYPKALGTATWKVGGLAFTGYQLTEKTITNEYGFSVTYYIYRSSNLQTGSSINAEIS